MQHRSVDPIELKTFLPYRLNVLASQVSEALARIYEARHGISIPEWRVLATLGQTGESTATAISDHARMHKTKVSRAVGDLVGRGFVGRRANAADKREAILTLTARGQAVYDDLVPHARTFSDALEAALTAADREALDGILTRLTARSQSLAAGGEAGEQAVETAQ